MSADEALNRYATFLEDTSNVIAQQAGRNFVARIPGSSSTLQAIMTNAFNDANNATERLVVLALLAHKPQLIPAIVERYPPSAGLSVLLSQLLEPYTNDNLDSYASTFGGEFQQNPDFTNSDILKEIANQGVTRIKQNSLIKDLLRARYGLLIVAADGFSFTPSSLREVGSLITKCEITEKQNETDLGVLLPSIQMMRGNYDYVESMLVFKESATQDAARKLKLLLDIV